MLEDVFDVGEDEDEDGEEPCAGVGKAKRNEGLAVGEGIDCAAVDKGWDEDADKHPCDKFACAGGERPHRFAYALHGVAQYEKRAEYEEQRKVDIQIRIAEPKRLFADFVCA